MRSENIQPEIELSEFVRLFFELKWIHVCVLLLSMSIALAYAYTTPRLYEATALYAFEDPSGGSQASDIFSGIGLFGSNSMTAAFNREMMRLSTHQVILDLIRDRNLMPSLFPRQWDQEKGRWIDPSTVPTPEEAVDEFRARLKVRPDADAKLVEVKFRNSDRQIAADVVGSLASKVNAEYRLQYLSESERRVAFINNRLAKTSNLPEQKTLFDLQLEELTKMVVLQVTTDVPFRRFDRPTVTRHPVWPNKKLILLAGLAFSALFMIGLTMFWPRRDRLESSKLNRRDSAYLSLRQ